MTTFIKLEWADATWFVNVADIVEFGSPEKKEAGEGWGCRINMRRGDYHIVNETPEEIFALIRAALTQEEQT